jgi:hypothetical protein
VIPAALSDDRAPDAIRTMRGASTHLVRGLQAGGQLEFLQVFKGLWNNGSNGVDELTIYARLFRRTVTNIKPTLFFVNL